jgi:hypothetical protein
MNANVKHIVEIAGGVIIGNLAFDAAEAVVKVVKKKVKNLKEKEA